VSSARLLLTPYSSWRRPLPRSVAHTSVCSWKQHKNNGKHLQGDDERRNQDLQRKKNLRGESYLEEINF
jgi:hypothetical protein